MACIGKHGRELDRREYCDCRVAVMSDGNVMRNYGQGWKLWKKVKPGVDFVQYAQSIRAKYDDMPEQFHRYIKALIDACDLKHRARLHMAVDLMPNDPDGVWSTMDLDDVIACCRARQRLLDCGSLSEPANRSSGGAVMKGMLISVKYRVREKAQGQS